MNQLSRIRLARKAKGYTQDEIANALGISRPSYMKFEDGSRDLTVTQALKLRELLGVSVIESPEKTLENIEKFRSMILAFIKYAGANDGRITKTKLAKLLYFADAQTYYNTSGMSSAGHTMSGLTYRKLPQGPVPYEFFQSIDEMVDSSILDIKFSGLAQMIEAVEAVNIDELGLEDNELKLIEDISLKWKDKRTDAIVNYSHEHPTWRNADNYAPIDMSLLMSFGRPIY